MCCCFGPHLKALLRKNWILWKRNYKSSCCEICLPIIFIFLLMALRSQISQKDLPEQSFIDNPYPVFPTVQAASQAFSYCNDLTNGGGKVVLIPNIDITQNIAAQLQQFPNIANSITYMQTNDQLDDQVSSSKYGFSYDRVCFAIVFNQYSNNKYEYYLRFNSSDSRVPETFLGNYENTFKKQQLNLNDMYNDNGFTTIVNIISNAILQKEQNNPNLSITPYTVPMKQEKQVSDSFYDTVGSNVNIYLVLPLIITFLRMTNSILIEKEKKIREGMKMMGMGNASFYMSWIITYAIIYFVIAVIISALLLVNIYNGGSFIFLLVWYYLFCLTLLFQSLFVTVFFTRARIGLLASMIFFLLQLILFWSFNFNNISQTKIQSIALSPHTAASISASHFAFFQSNGNKIDFSILGETFSNYQEGFTFISFFLNIFVFGILFLYLDQVFPNEFGSKKHPLFFLGIGSSDSKAEQAELLIQTQENKTVFEPVDAALKAQAESNQALVIKGLVKIFNTNGAQKRAVDNLSLEMYNSQVFSFLGHNGAGKTTTISMITGLLNPTQGEIKVKGLDVRSQMTDIRKIMGVCPQHDILFDDLTVKEHLELFSNLKGVPQNEQEKAIQKIIQDVDLTEKTNYLSKSLSGGQKRKLSVAIAFIGGSQVILLDEPTSGMDVEARRHIWDMLKNYKQDKIVILTTHFMDEADYLGDRIGIISDGNLKCVGSSIFLKTKYGKGYNFTFVKNENTSPSEPLIKFMKDNMPESDLISDVSAEIAFQVPLKNISLFRNFFSLLEQQKQQLHVRSYGISITTLEQVFLSVASENNNHSKHVEKKQSLKVDDFDLNQVRIKGEFNIFWTHFKALCLKRIRYFKRDLGGFFCEIFLPIIIIVIGMSLNKLSTLVDQPSQILTPELYSKSQMTYSGNPNNYQNFVNSIPTYGSSTFKKVQDPATTLAQLDSNFFAQKSLQNKFAVFYQYDASKPTTYAYTSILNTQNGDIGPLSVNLINNGIINSLTNKQIVITPYNYPLKNSYYTTQMSTTSNGISAALMFSIGLSFIPASIITFIVREREEQIKHQQIVSGVSVFAYWVSNFFIDFAKYLIPGIICPLFALAFSVNSLTQDGVFSCFYIIFILYGPAIILFTYAFSFTSKNYGNAQLGSFFLHFVFGCIISITIFFLRIIPATASASKIICWFVRLIPSLSFGLGILNMTSRSIYQVLENSPTKESAWSINIAGGDILMIGLSIIFYSFIILLIEKFHSLQMFNKETDIPFKPKKIDSDVQKEIEHVKTSDPKDYVIHVNGLRKVFIENKNNYKVAVDNINFCIKNGEVFSLLGVNGAGKTTTMRMLTGDEQIVTGQAHIQGFKIPDQIKQAQQYIGYCPQFDALLDNLTSREHLELYAAIKGIPSDLIPQLVEQKLDEMNLRKFENVCAGTYSGGNKRKLSVAIAMLGNPPIVFLDEPSTGMDPGNRRFMWDVISRISTERKRSSIILTTHSMEEAEALSTKVGIMVAGNFQCMGSVQHLKNKFGNGYEIDIRTELPTQSEIKELARNTDIKMQVGVNQIREYLGQINALDIYNTIKPDGFCAQLYYELQRKEQTQGINAKLILEFLAMYRKTQKVEQYLKNTFGDYSLIEQFNNFSRYRIQAKQTIGEIFSMLYENEKQLHFNQYTVNQPTLEQIFNYMAKHAENTTTAEYVQKQNQQQQIELRQKNQSQGNNNNNHFLLAQNLEAIELDQVQINQKKNRINYQQNY
ncbi:hypothetical protein ABPG74_002290 [Tetrahymena malaccensis]